MRYFPDFKMSIEYLEHQMRTESTMVQAGRWQGVDLSDNMRMRELLDITIRTRCDNELWEEDIKPNMPWANDHFLERVCGEPINPGEQWAKWPWGHSADKFRDQLGQFDHNYMERYWPKFAGQFTRDGESHDSLTPNFGIRRELGDLDDLVALLRRDPLTRQAYLPVWFPEDTGMVHRGRAPCSLGYHFIIRNDEFSCVYYMRSCDMRRHMRDDIYLTVRLMDWIRHQVVHKGGAYPLGFLTIHFTSLHIFENDFREMFGA